jgi:hypothetical protein
MLIRKERSLYYYPILIRIKYKKEGFEFMILDRKLTELLEDKLIRLETAIQTAKV